MNRIFLAVIVSLLLGNITFTAYAYFKPTNKAGYIYIDKVYDQFKAKAEVEKELKIMENKQNSLLDSIRFQTTYLENNLKVASSADKAKIQNMLQDSYVNYERLVKDFSEYNTKESSKQMQSLLKQINQYVKDYGDENKYDFIYGANGSGSLMYASDKKDLTQEIAIYVNKKYAGK